MPASLRDCGTDTCASFGTVETIIQGASQSSGLGAATGFLLGKGMSGWFGVAHHFDIGLCFQIDVG